MTCETRIPDQMPAPYKLPHAATAIRPDQPAEPMSRDAIGDIETHLGGAAVLKSLGASALAADHNHVSFTLGRANPKGIRTVVITAEPDGRYRMDCYAPRELGRLTAPRAASATGIVAENLATVLGQLSGVETIHHRHF